MRQCAFVSYVFSSCFILVPLDQKMGKNASGLTYIRKRDFPPWGPRSPGGGPLSYRLCRVEQGRPPHDRGRIREPMPPAFNSAFKARLRHKANAALLTHANPTADISPCRGSLCVLWRFCGILGAFTNEDEDGFNAMAIWYVSITRHSKTICPDWLFPHPR